MLKIIKKFCMSVGNSIEFVENLITGNTEKKTKKD